MCTFVFTSRRQGLMSIAPYLAGYPFFVITGYPAWHIRCPAGYQIYIYFYFYFYIFWPQVEVPPSTLRFYSFTQWSCSAPRIIVGDAGFEPGTSATGVWRATNVPPHLRRIIRIWTYPDMQPDDQIIPVLTIFLWSVLRSRVALALTKLVYYGI